ncbi:MotA/TolQ/ExbB proton channel family protein [Vicingus serpentipes]|uniref:MotA/TolQ/ExbB proton channel family protein n=1 Tax=Vicingus serpentipes TaxID=1926625 RepID=A0A5C6RRK3_9FLAO|nr:MotA/TolQ/ExbB proton channel family protein [Vicingus serpentipes]TXB64022.1 MotA/TolQ/ExbB proton channel family protein [Vicingus serpentipes]
MLSNFLLQINVAGTPALNEVENVVSEEKTLTIWQLVSSGGVGGAIIMIALLILSILAVYIIVERYLSIKKASKEDANFMNQIKDFILDGKIDAAQSLCKSNSSPVAKMIEKGISRIGKPLSDIGTAVENTAKLELNKLEKNLSTLATISGAAPMIGFLGTVIGMIMVFHKMASAGGNIDVEMLSEGIYTAMVTTVAGLIVGIVAYIGYNLLVAKMEKIVFIMEARTTEFLDILHEPAV